MVAVHVGQRVQHHRRHASQHTAAAYSGCIQRLHTAAAYNTQVTQLVVNLLHDSSTQLISTHLKSGAKRILIRVLLPLQLPDAHLAKFFSCRGVADLGDPQDL